MKPCVRCTIPDVDPATAETGTQVNEALRAYRSNERMKGGLTFAMNAIVLDGVDATLRVGQDVTANWNF